MICLCSSVHTLVFLCLLLLVTFSMSLAYRKLVVDRAMNMFVYSHLYCFFLYFQQPGKMRACRRPYDDVFVFICTYICACVFITICRFFQQPGKMRACSRPCDDGEQSQRQSCPPDQIQMHGFQQKKNKCKKVHVKIQKSTSTKTKITGSNANELMPVMSQI